nr:sensory rhodopsin transducer [Nostoc sp. FACHB-888]
MIDDRECLWKVEPKIVKQTELKFKSHEIREKTYQRICWAITEGYIPAYSNGPKPQFTSHETVYVLNANDKDAHLVEIMIYYSDREPVGS